MRRYDRAHTLFYMDPPYWATEGYDAEFGLEQYERTRLARLIIDRAAVSC